RHLVLLALVAGYHLRGITRDKLLGYFWPESDTQHARNSLKQALYSVRQSLEMPLVACEGGVVRLDPTFIEVDVWQFQAALDRGDEVGAVGLYRGPYLDGCYLSGRDELERWIDAERDRLAQQYADAVRILAQRAEAKGNSAGAVVWWRRLTAADPLCSTAALGLMRALAASGDPTAAREHAREHAAYVRAELGGPVAEAVVAFANQLRSNPAPPKSTRPQPRSDQPPHPLVRRGPDRRSGPVAAPPTASTRWAEALLLPAVPRGAWKATAVLWVIALLSMMMRLLSSH
ncbi:MAG TPA: BTAD domain-containing putative transcriptional regulator, partial [Gemmatimonadales bacterium]|nr:BTAD domain-containing putative transcriptional regulator [Gemmatimonadales bacterium]